jgi:hypothetical protein
MPTIKQALDQLASKLADERQLDQQLKAAHADRKALERRIADHLGARVFMFRGKVLRSDPNSGVIGEVKDVSAIDEDEVLPEAQAAAVARPAGRD